MKKASFKYIIIASGIALLGIILLQVLGAYNSLKLKQQSSKEHIQMSLHSISHHVCRDSLLHNTPDLEYEIEESLKDLFEKDVKEGDYQIAILNHTKRKILYSNTSDNISDIQEYPYQEFGLCSSHDEDVYLFLNVNLKDNYLRSSFIIWTLFSMILITIVVLSFYYVVTTYLRQNRLSMIKNDFINNMSHELKTPIATMSVASEMLVREEVFSDSKRSERYAHIIRDESLRLRNLVDRVLNIAIFEKQQPSFRTESINIHELILKAVKPFELIVEKRQGELVLELNAKVAIVLGDADHLTQTLTNLIDNAIKYSPDMLYIKIDTSNKDHYICIQVEDKGLGIDKKEKERIFEKFHRIGNGDVHDIKGFGIGLYYVKRVIEHHKGKLDVYSNGKKGSRFSVFIPTN